MTNVCSLCKISAPETGKLNCAACYAKYDGSRQIRTSCPQCGTPFGPFGCDTCNAAQTSLKNAYPLASSFLVAGPTSMSTVGSLATVYPQPYGCQICGQPIAMGLKMCYRCDAVRTMQVNTPTVNAVISSWKNYGRPSWDLDTPSKIFTREKSSEVIVGYRVWRLNKQNGVHLQSGSQDTIWPWRRAVEKTKFAGEDGGIHACKTVRKMLEILQEYRRGYVNPDDAIYFGGEISLWGDVDEYTEGYKAQYGYPRRLFVGEQTDPCTIMELEDAYGIPCEFRKEFNAPDPNALTRDGDILWSGTSGNMIPQWSSYKFFL